MAYLTLLLDLALIGLLAAGIAYAVKLTRQLADMRAGRVEMERFVQEFNATVLRAEAGVRGLKTAARTGGDDLEKLIEKAHSLRDELHFLIESADQIASRLSDTAAIVTRAASPEPEPSALKAAPASKPAAAVPANEPAAPQKKQAATSAAERELMQALEKLGGAGL